jgi:hypothetical protein
MQHAAQDKNELLPDPTMKYPPESVSSTIGSNTNLNCLESFTGRDKDISLSHQNTFCQGDGR